MRDPIPTIVQQRLADQRTDTENQEESGLVQQHLRWIVDEDRPASGVDHQRPPSPPSVLVKERRLLTL